MPPENKTSRLLLMVSILLFQIFSNTGVVFAENTVRFSAPSVENRFPDELFFRVTVSSSGSEIVSAKFVYTFESKYSSVSYTKESLEVTAGTEMVLEYALDTRDSTTPPMMPITYYWDVVDAGGNHYESEPVTIHYEDTRFEWQSLENANVGVWWHDRPASFGETLFTTANAAFLSQKKLFQSDLDYQMRVVIYNTRQEFAAWHGMAYDWVGGETFSNYGITTQIVEDTGFQKSWLNDVIPHEISHLYFAQVTYNPTVSIPVWLNEGLSQYNEFTDNNWELNEVRTAAKTGTLIPLSALANGFGAFNEERIYLAYYESVSAVTYLIETYGDDGLRALLQAYRQGQTTAEAFPSAIGISAGDFEAEWAVWTGFSGVYATNTPWPMPTFIPSPTMHVQGGTSGVAPTGTPASPPTSISPTGAVSTSTPQSAPLENKPAPTPSLPCLSFGITLSLGAGGILINKRRKNRRDGEHNHE
ncbi:MAG: hypothetical protein L3J16_03800 [Anaerolineales bacterium]|nr:hypothetical protein [Anaerolineales bacterium]